MSDEITKQRLLYGNFEYDDTHGRLFRYDEIVDLFQCNIDEEKTTYISCDVARFGEDRTVICVWKGLRAIRFFTLINQPTDIVADRVLELEKEWLVNRNHIVIDAD